MRDDISSTMLEAMKWKSQKFDGFLVLGNVAK